MITFSSNLVFKLKALCIYQLISAIAGLLVTFSLFLQDGFQDPEITIIIIAIILTLYLFAIYCGISCFQMKNKCLWYSSINLYLQLISVSIVGYGFQYISGLAVNLGIDLTTNFAIGLKMEILSFWHIDYNSGSDAIFVNLNLVALAVILFIDRMKRQMKHEIEEELLTIGGSGI